MWCLTIMTRISTWVATCSGWLVIFKTAFSLFLISLIWDFGMAFKVSFCTGLWHFEAWCEFPSWVLFWGWKIFFDDTGADKNFNFSTWIPNYVNFYWSCSNFVINKNMRISKSCNYTKANKHSRANHFKSLLHQSKKRRKSTLLYHLVIISHRPMESPLP